MEAIVKASVKLIYQGKNISRDVSPLMLDFTYTDKTEGETDELSITFRNDDLRWLGSWRPTLGDTIEATIIDENNIQLPCGVFTVDNVTASGGTTSGDTFTINCMAAGVKEDTRTKRTVAHESKTLKEIVNKIAAKHGYSVQGIFKDFKIKYIAQVRETDLAFLHRLAMEYGYAFSVRGNKLIFTALKDLHGNKEVLTVEYKTDTSYSVNEKLTKVYSKAKLKHRNASSNQLIEKEVTATNNSKDTLLLHRHVDDEQQAEIIADNKLYRHNLQQIEMGINDLPGNIYLVSGNNVTHKGWGTYDGKYCIKESTHHVSRDNSYTTTYTGNKL